MITAKIVADSLARHGKRITTLQLRYPRFIHAEFMTHRVFSRNASSSRAIPVAKVLEQVCNDPAMPLHWGANQPGMQANGEVDDQTKHLAAYWWSRAAQDAAHWADRMSNVGLHKQVANRLLEPFQFMHVVVTSTEWDNFFELRDHPAAEPHMQMLAREMKRAMLESTPIWRPYGGSAQVCWHLPYVSDEERQYDRDLLPKISAARCARVSYLNHDGTQPNVDKDLELFERLAGSRPRHASPLEHQAHPIDGDEQSRNFVGWRQFRELIES